MRGAFHALGTLPGMLEVRRREVTVVGTRTAETAFGGRLSLTEARADRLQQTPRGSLATGAGSSPVGNGGELTWVADGLVVCGWVLRAPCGLQQAGPRFEQRKASPKLKSCLGLELSEQEAQAPGLCKLTHGVGTIFRGSVLDSGRWVERRVHVEVLGVLPLGPVTSL